MPNFLHTIVVTCLVRNREGLVLMVRHRDRGWELPQGRVEEGEGVLDALFREVHEETGIVIGAPRLAAIWSKVSAPAAVIHGFVADHASGIPSASDETPEVRWLPETECLDQISHPVNRDRFIDLAAASDSVRFYRYATGPYRRIPFAAPSP